LLKLSFGIDPIFGSKFLEHSYVFTFRIVKDVENQKPSFGLTPQCQDNMPIDLVPAENKIHSNTEENKTTDQKER